MSRMKTRMKNGVMRRNWILALSCAPLILGGCGPAAVSVGKALQRAAQNNSQDVPVLGASPQVPPPQSADEAALVKQAQADATQWATQTLATAPRVQSGRGIVICEPVVANGTPRLGSSKAQSSTRLMDFGAGCARWLQLQAGGQGELGRTPSWGLIADIQNELKYPSLRLQPAQAFALAPQTSATHVAVGTLQAAGERSTLTYRVLDVKTRQAVGAPIQAVGTREQIVAQLPQMARTIAARLGVQNASVATPHLSPDELAFLGNVPRKGKYGNVTYPMEVRMRNLSARDSLAGVLWIYSEASDAMRFWRLVTDNTKRLAGNNALVWATLGWKAPRWVKSGSPLDALAARYPDNVALVAARYNGFALKNDLQGRLKTGMRLVALTPASAFGWELLALTFSEQAEAVRHSRYNSDMSAAEQSQIAQLYPSYASAAIYATKLDPQSGDDWLQACKGAVFNGDDSATALFWQAMRVEPDNADVYNWGLQMFQPKWGGDTNSLRRVVALAKTRPEVLPWLVDQISWAYDATGISSEFPPVPRRAVFLAKKLVASQPQKLINRMQLAKLLGQSHQAPAALQQLQQGAQAWPESIDPILQMAAIYADPMHDYPNAEKRYSQVMQLDPGNPTLVLTAAKHYKDIKRDADKAEPLFRRAMQLDPTDAEAVTGLANIRWFLRDDEKTGGPLFQKAIALSGDSGAAYAEYAWALMRHNQRDAAMVQARKAVHLGFYDHPVIKALGLRN